MDVSVIIVNYNTKELTLNCLRSIYGSVTKYSFEIFLVDNDSSDGSAAAIREQFPNVRIIENIQNVGFARANNQAAEISTGRYMYILNSDTEIEGDVLEKVITYGDRNPDVGLIGTKVVFPDGQLYGNFYMFQTFLSELMFFTIGIIKQRHWSFFHSNKYKEFSLEEPSDVDVISGCSLFVKRSVYDTMGLFNDRFFMYYEDGEFCYRVKKKGFRAVYLPTSSIKHIHKGSVKGNDNEFIVLVECFRSACIYFSCINGRFSSMMFKAICKFFWMLELMLLGLMLTVTGNEKAKRKVNVLQALLRG